uniref:Uncharacterized protein n=1 Tax=Romanomermis culicivorax TaxID=13658 RepID=A0A915KTX5_ROMCU
MKKEIAGSNRITNLQRHIYEEVIETELQLELKKEDNGQRMANMEETIEQVARKFANLAEDSDHSQTMDMRDHADQRAQTSSGSSSFEKIGISSETNYISISNPQLTPTIPEIDAKIDFEIKVRNEVERLEGKYSGCSHFGHL